MGVFGLASKEQQHFQKPAWLCSIPDMASRGPVQFPATEILTLRPRCPDPCGTHRPRSLQEQLLGDTAGSPPYIALTQLLAEWFLAQELRGSSEIIIAFIWKLLQRLLRRLISSRVFMGDFGARSDRLSHCLWRPKIPLFGGVVFKSKGTKHLSGAFAQTPKISIKKS